MIFIHFFVIFSAYLFMRSFPTFKQPQVHQMIIVELMRGLASVNVMVVSANDVIVAFRPLVVMLVFTPVVVLVSLNVNIP